MAYIDRAYVPGDEISITTQVQHDAKIAGIEAVYVLEGTESAEIRLTEGKTEGQVPAGTPTIHGKPYLNGQASITGVIAADQAPGVYVLKSVTWTTANRQKLTAQTVPESRIRVAEVPQDIHVNGWQLGGGARVGELE